MFPESFCKSISLPAIKEKIDKVDCYDNDLFLLLCSLRPLNLFEYLVTTSVAD
jgi:hypothetical protein